MSGTDMRRQAPHPESEPTAVEQHLGDRLAALIDGELGHDARDRVLAHLATCWGCKAEAEAQRRLKSVFADAAPPPPSDGLLARLQGLPAGGPDGPPAASGDASRGGADLDPTDPTEPGRMAAQEYVRASATDTSPLSFAYLRGGADGSVLSPPRGFRIHDMERHASRGRRFAFAAAGAVSLAALALGSVFNPGLPGAGSTSGGGDGGPSASSVRTTPSSGNGADRDRRRRDTGRSRNQQAGAAALAAAQRGSTSGAAPLDPSRSRSPWESPAAPVGPSRSGSARTVYPLLQNAAFHSALTGGSSGALPSVSYETRHDHHGSGDSRRGAMSLFSTSGSASPPPSAPVTAGSRPR